MLLLWSPGVHLVGTVADRLLAERLRILVEGCGQRHVRGVPEHGREGGVRRVQRDDERVVVLDIESAQLRVLVDALLLQLVIALDGAEERGGDLPVRRVGGVAPRLREGFGGHRRTVSEFPPVPEGDGVLRGVGVGLDALGDLVFGGAVLLVGDQAGEHLAQHDDGRRLVGVAGDQLALGLEGRIADDVLPAVVGGSRGTAASGQCHGGRADGGYGGDQGLPAHDSFPFSLLSSTAVSGDDGSQGNTAGLRTVMRGHTVPPFRPFLTRPGPRDADGRDRTQT